LLRAVELWRNGEFGVFLWTKVGNKPPAANIVRGFVTVAFEKQILTRISLSGLARSVVSHFGLGLLSRTSRTTRNARISATRAGYSENKTVKYR
jgi:hypothetical protein